MYANQVNGKVGAIEAITSGMDFITITTTVNITPGVFGSANQAALNKLIEVVSQNCQPVLLSSAYSDGNGNFILKMANEHTGTWAPATLLAAIAANAATFGFTNVNTTVAIASAF